ncbi:MULTISPECIES: DMT family transporter [Sphingobacterium]|uniref:DMT family transporter n=1 Tax=Sphingobacterium TaxID=28453 RepID=UPI00257CBBF3|nr:MULTISPECIES: SMR family transporter [Sphingobacterium]
MPYTYSSLSQLKFLPPLLPVGASHAIWSGIGIVVITLIGMILFKHIPDTVVVIGMLLIFASVIINVFSKMDTH